MARIRTIKPDFWSDGTLLECSLNARLFFIGTWNFADDYGNLDRSAKQLKARVFPAEAFDCEPLIQELIAHGRLIEYSVNGMKYLHIHNFEKHQVINRKGKPHCPAYEPSVPIHGVLRDDSVGKGREGNGKEGSNAGQEPSAPSPSPVEFIPLQDGTDFPVTADFVAELDRAYPAVDVPQTLREIRAWNLSNPGKRKTLRGVRKHIHTWIAGEQQKAGAH